MCPKHSEDYLESVILPLLSPLYVGNWWPTFVQFVDTWNFKKAAQKFFARCQDSGGPNFENFGFKSTTRVFESSPWALQEVDRFYSGYLPLFIRPTWWACKIRPQQIHSPLNPINKCYKSLGPRPYTNRHKDATYLVLRLLHWFYDLAIIKTRGTEGRLVTSFTSKTLTQLVCVQIATLCVLSTKCFDHLGLDI